MNKNQQTMINMCKAGHAVREIADTIGYSKQGVYRILRIHNIKPKDYKLPPKMTDQEKKIINMYQARVPVGEIAKTFDYKTDKSVYDVLLKYGIKPNRKRVLTN